MVLLTDTIFDEESRTWHGPQPFVPLYDPNISVGAVLLNTLRLNPNHIGQISDENDLKLTNEEIRLRSIRTIYKLQEFGIKMDDMVGIIVRNSYNVAPIVIACLTIGAQMNPLDPTFTNEDIVNKFVITQPKIVFCDEENFTVVQKACKDIDIEPLFIITLGRIAGYPAVDDFFTAIGTEDNYMPPALIDGTNQTAIILNTSGTTATSKGCCISHAAILYQCYKSPLYSHDIILSFSSLFWIAGIQTVIAGTMLSLTRIITTKSFNPELMLRLIEKYRVSYVYTVPVHLSALIHSPIYQTTDLSSLRLYVTGGTFLSQSLIEKFYTHNQLRNMPGFRLSIVYGMTECFGAVTMNESHPEFGSVGKIYTGVAMRIIDLNGGRCAIGEIGEIWMQMPYNFLGYYLNEEETRRTIDANGWMRSGDNGYFDENGNLFITRRTKDILKYANYQISPTEIEDVISRHPNVEAVCVVGIDEIVNDLPAAVIIPRKGYTIDESDVKKLVEENLADYKRLRGGVYFVDEMPMTPSGKIIRRKVQEYANELYLKTYNEK